MKKLIVFLITAALIWLFIWGSNNWIQTTEYTISSEKLPEAFDGKKIVQVSDLHNAMFGNNQKSLIEKVEKAEPDAIFITGDLIDSERYDLDTALILVDALVEMSDVYFVTGNHEVAVNKLEDIKAALVERGVIYLENEAVEWEVDGEVLQIAGIHDPLMDMYYRDEEYTRDAIATASLTDDFTLLLAHRPEQIAVYADNEIDVVFSGHAHGGQVRIPGLGGLFAPGQGWFPRMTEGIFENRETQLVLSRGLGNSGFPLRILNLPEIVSVTLEKTE
ncbi:metallophosphoesterase [Planomicrobium okeanokoites]|uniref:Metallophosphoesterase n=1 Tax=Planomicrobium okeanokoites TaxID=244 RepID=A0ABV7KS21_PLAOK|nr:metallophosphoesterase [Planomicrobium okeanokoites]TAA69877.1 metallophosphoesterase [Planomicrobium okeanokoites]